MNFEKMLKLLLRLKYYLRFLVKRSLVWEVPLDIFHNLGSTVLPLNFNISHRGKFGYIHFFRDSVVWRS